jgi:hypothetical protein
MYVVLTRTLKHCILDMSAKVSRFPFDIQHSYTRTTNKCCLYIANAKCKWFFMVILIWKKFT